MIFFMVLCAVFVFIDAEEISVCFCAPTPKYATDNETEVVGQIRTAQRVQFTTLTHTTHTRTHKKRHEQNMGTTTRQRRAATGETTGG